MKKSIIALVVLLIGFGAPAIADTVYIPVLPEDWSGSRTVGAGLTATGSWATQGITVSWEITFDAGEALPYTYVYTFTNSAGAPLTGKPSHFIFEVSENFNVSNFDFDGTFVGPDDYDRGNGNANPNFPEGKSFWGIKLDEGQNSYEFSTSVAPIWGDIYAKDGDAGGEGTNAVWNTGLGSDPLINDDPFTNWIAVPDTIGAPPPPVIPEPSTLLLLGSGVLGLGIMGRRFRK